MTTVDKAMIDECLRQIDASVEPPPDQIAVLRETLNLVRAAAWGARRAGVDAIADRLRDAGRELADALAERGVVIIHGERRRGER
jgi:hypothetical protein